MNRTKRYAIGVLAALLVMVPIGAHAATPEELKAQIASLLQQITALQQQLASLTASSGVTATSSSQPVGAAISCPDISRPLFRGLRGEDVSGLQRFLVEQKVLGAEDATGFYGPITEQAVQRWQQSQGVVTSGDAGTTGFGVVGAKTRELIRRACGNSSQVIPNVLPPSATRASTTPPKACPMYMPPLCTTGTLVSKGTDSNGCDLGAECRPASCPAVFFPKPQCPDGQSAIQNFSSSGCNLGYECKIAACPAVFFPKPECPAGESAFPKFSSGGCHMGYECRKGIIIDPPPPPKDVCRAIVPPACPTGTLVSKGTDGNGCSLGYECKITQPPSCPLYMPPQCLNGKLVSLGTDANGCNLGAKCEPIQLTATLNLGSDGTIRSTSKQPTISGTLSHKSTSIRIEVALQSGDVIYDSGLFTASGTGWSKTIGKTLEPATYTITVYGPGNEQLARTLLHILE